MSDSTIIDYPAELDRIARALRGPGIDPYKVPLDSTDGVLVADASQIMRMMIADMESLKRQIPKPLSEEKRAWILARNPMWDQE